MKKDLRQHCSKVEKEQQPAIQPGGSCKILEGKCWGYELSQWMTREVGGATGEDIWRGVNLDRKFGWRQRREMRLENDSASRCISSKMLMLCWRFPGWSSSSVAKNLPSSAGDAGSVRPLVRELGDLSSQAAATEPVHHNGGALRCSEDLRQLKVNKKKTRPCSRRKAFRRGRRWVQSGVILRTSSQLLLYQRERPTGCQTLGQKEPRRWGAHSGRRSVEPALGPSCDIWAVAHWGGLEDKQLQGPSCGGCSCLLPSAHLSWISQLLYFQFLWISFYIPCYSDLPSHPLPGDGQGWELVHLRMNVLGKSRDGGDGLKWGGLSGRQNS